MRQKKSVVSKDDLEGIVEKSSEKAKDKQESSGGPSFEPLDPQKLQVDVVSVCILGMRMRWGNLFTFTRKQCGGSSGV